MECQYQLQFTGSFLTEPMLLVCEDIMLINIVALLVSEWCVPLFCSILMLVILVGSLMGYYGHLFEDWCHVSNFPVISAFLLSSAAWKITVSECAIWAAVSLRKRAGIQSGPAALWGVSPSRRCLTPVSSMLKVDNFGLGWFYRVGVHLGPFWWGNC